MDELDTILTRYLADVDDAMEYGSNESKEIRVNKRQAEARAALLAWRAKAERGARIDELRNIIPVWKPEGADELEGIQYHIRERLAELSIEPSGQEGMPTAREEQHELL